MASTVDAPLPEIEEEESIDLNEESKPPPRMTIQEFCDAFICTAREQGAPMDLMELLEEHAQFINREFALVDVEKARTTSVMYKKSMASLMLNYMHANRSEIEADSVKTTAWYMACTDLFHSVLVS